MILRTLILCSSVILAQAASADLGVWEQLEMGHVDATRGIVKSVDYQTLDVYVKIETTGALGNKTETLSKLCRDNDWSEEMRAALFKAKAEVLEDSRKHKTPVEFGTRGTFNSCLSFVRSVTS